MHFDLLQAVSTFAVGMGGALSMVKLLKLIESRPAEKEKKRIAALFPNGEKAEIIGAIDELRQNARDEHRARLELTSQVRKIAQELGVSL